MSKKETMSKKELAVQVALGTTWSDEEIAAAVDWYFGTCEDSLREYFNYSEIASDPEFFKIVKTLGIKDPYSEEDDGEDEPDKRFLKLLKEVRKIDLRKVVIEAVTRKIRGNLCKK